MVVNRSQGALARSRRALTLVVGLCLLPIGCSVQLIASHDELTVKKTAEVHEMCEALFLAIEKAAATPEKKDDLYPAHELAYDEIVVGLRVLELRASTLAQNEITAEQLHGWLESMQRIQKLHQEKTARQEGFSAEAVMVLREPVLQQVRSILVLQEALKRGK